ncbi:MAG: type II secretion system minor pseudopilin GspI [Gammaproteobacteria bacterium]|nr:type II secretion system minor pseudopilin GspI [Gammaproteobacteria bacterium]
MNSSTCKLAPSKTSSGFTLLEVLIALMVLATALVALSGTMTMTTKTQIYQKERTYSHYIAMYRLGELKTEEPWPNTGTTRGSINMLNREWRWKQEVQKTTEDGLRRVDIKVSLADDEDYVLGKITAFLGRPPELDPRQ